MCEIIISKSSILKLVVDSYKDIITDGIWNFSEDGIVMQAIDSSHIFICEMKLSCKMFSSYSCKSSVSVGILFSNLAKILKCSANDDSVTMKLNGTESINISFKNKTSKKSSKFVLKTVETDHENLDIPEKIFDCNICVSGKEFKSIMSDLSHFGDDCTINVSENMVNFSVKGDTGEGDISLTDLKSKIIKPVKLTFSINHLLNFTKTVALSEDINICMSDDCPMMVTYNMEHNSFIKFYLAPKIDSE